MADGQAPHSKTQVKAPPKIKQIVKPISKTMSVGGGTIRKSLNITEEALAIGKVPPEDIARMIAKG